MSTQVTLPQFHLVQKMLRSQVRHCDIARELNLSVWTISRIAGDLKVAGTLRVPTLAFGDDGGAEEDNGTRSVPTTLPEDDAPPDYVATNLRRCQGCGGMVYQWPCLTCQLRARAQARS